MGNLFKDQGLRFQDQGFRFPSFTLKTILLLGHVDAKNTLKNVALGFFIKSRFSSSFNLLGQNEETPSEGIPQESTQGYESGGG